jgi:Bucentaur or craniofacial development
MNLTLNSVAITYSSAREVADVPVDSADAKKWPVWRAPELEGTPPIASGSGTPQETQVSIPSDTDTSSATTTSVRPLARRPGPRKPKVSLASIPTQKAKKLSTLDKSAMDWQKHIQAQESSGLKDELEANRRGGGYLEKVDFLKRVDERKDDVFEASKSSKRRKL